MPRKIHFLWCMGSKFCVKFQRVPLKFHTKFWSHISQNVHITDFHFSLWLMIPWNCDIISLNTLRWRQDGRHFADDTFKCIFLNANVRILLKISLKFVAKGPINNISALVQIMAWSDQATSHYLNQCWYLYRCIYASLGNELMRRPPGKLMGIYVSIWIE